MRIVPDRRTWRWMPGRGVPGEGTQPPLCSSIERTGRNPRTGETIKIKASKNPAFKAGKALKDAVN
jgi:hypothetical protein